jgi:riboflavin kinase/FMN adenylyltransferase
MKVYSGVAQRGEGHGTVLGFPTANIPLEDELSGIYAARVTIQGKEYFAAVYANPHRKLLEAHLLDFWGELYGQHLTIEIHTKIRESADFTDATDLKAAIAKDVHEVRKYFKVQ